MSGGHAPRGPDGLYVPGASPLHRAAPEAKVAATLAFVAAVVVTPREQAWAFGVHALAALGAVASAGLPAGLVARRLRVEVPFVAFALLLPVVGAAPRVDVAGVALSRPGLWGAWNVLAKATLGVLASVTLAATTTVPDLLRGLERLRAPRVVTGIALFMVRYLGVVADEGRRMHVARQSRGYDPRWLWQARGAAASAGTLFVRSYERGERVHLAMASRGYTGTMPDLTGATTSPDAAGRGGPAGRARRWAPAAAPAAAWAVALVALAAA